MTYSSRAPASDLLPPTRSRLLTTHPAMTFVDEFSGLMTQMLLYSSWLRTTSSSHSPSRDTGTLCIQTVTGERVHVAVPSMVAPEIIVSFSLKLTSVVQTSGIVLAVSTFYTHRDWWDRVTSPTPAEALIRKQRELPHFVYICRCLHQHWNV